jgi:hypothetical protein
MSQKTKKILEYDDYESFLRSASKESVDLVFANYIPYSHFC